MHIFGRICMHIVWTYLNNVFNCMLLSVVPNMEITYAYGLGLYVCILSGHAWLMYSVVCIVACGPKHGNYLCIVFGLMCMHIVWQ